MHAFVCFTKASQFLHRKYLSAIYTSNLDAISGFHFLTVHKILMLDTPDFLNRINQYAFLVSQKIYHQSDMDRFGF